MDPGSGARGSGIRSTRMRTTFDAAPCVRALAAAVFAVRASLASWTDEGSEQCTGPDCGLFFAGAAEGSNHNPQVFGRSDAVWHGQAEEFHLWKWSRVSRTATTADGVLLALHTVSVVHAIRGLYSIHNPTHDYNNLLHKYEGEEEALLAAVANKYIYEPARAQASDGIEAPAGSSFAIFASLPFVAASGWIVSFLAITWKFLAKKYTRRRKNRRRSTNRKAFMCPISLELMVDPVVVLESGQTYERVAIEQWFRTHDTDPVSNVRLTSKKITPNHALRHAIEGTPQLPIPTASAQD